MLLVSLPLSSSNSAQKLHTVRLVQIPTVRSLTGALIHTDQGLVVHCDFLGTWLKKKVHQKLNNTRKSLQ